jgi:membrane fusion protein, copper/silver efflux system
MSRKNVVIAVTVLLVLVLAVYLSGPSAFKTRDKGVDAMQPSQAAQHVHGDSTQAEPQTDGAAAEQQNENEEPPTVEIPPDKQKMIGARTAEVSMQPIQKTIRTVGRIEYDEKRISTVNTKIDGWIERLYVDYSGRYVKKGEPLAEIFSPELIATQKEFINVLRWAKNKEGKDGLTPSRVSGMLSSDADNILDASRQRLRLWDISEKQIKKIEASGEPLRTVTVYSPVSGYVIQKMAVKGMKVGPGEKLFDIADLSTVWILADVYEYEMPLIKIGQTARITLSYFPDKEFSSRIDYVYPTLSGSTRTGKVRFEIANYKGMLKPQMYTDVAIKTNMGKKLAIPEDAIIDTGTRQIVYVDKGDGNFEPREVRLGIKGERFREVIAGLKAGEKVASSATFLIDSEAKLKNVTPLERHSH